MHAETGRYSHIQTEPERDRAGAETQTETHIGIQRRREATLYIPIQPSTHRGTRMHREKSAMPHRDNPKQLETNRDARMHTETRIITQRQSDTHRDAERHA